MSITEAGVSGNGSGLVSQQPRLPGSLTLTFGARGGRRQPLARRWSQGEGEYGSFKPEVNSRRMRLHHPMANQGNQTA